jgi:hypothetical protein
MFPATYLIDGNGLNVSERAQWLLTIPGEIEHVLSMSALARLIPFRFFNISPAGLPECVSRPSLSETIDAQDPWETTAQYLRRIGRARDQERCEALLFSYEQSFSQQIENCAQEKQKTFAMFWVVFPAMPKIPKDPMIQSYKCGRMSQLRASMESYQETAKLRELTRQGLLDYNTINEWRVLPTVRSRSGLEPRMIGVQPSVSGNYRFAQSPLTATGEGKVGFVVVSI